MSACWIDEPEHAAPDVPGRCPSSHWYRELRTWKILVALLTAFLGFAALADDTDIYFADTPAGQASLVIILDTSPGMYDTVCDAVERCRPPLLSADVYRELLALRSEAPPGTELPDEVSRLEVLRAILVLLLDDPDRDELSVAVLTSASGGRTALLAAYEPLRESRPVLREALAELPLSSANGALQSLDVALTYYYWFRYINAASWPGGPRPGAEVFSDGACPRLFSILATAAPGPATLTTATRQLLAQDRRFPGAAMTSESSLLQALHTPQADLLFGVDGIQSLRRTWVVAPDDAVAFWRRSTARSGDVQVASLSHPRELERALGQGMDRMLAAGQLRSNNPAAMVATNTASWRNQLFIGLFQADVSPRWSGNLKKLKLVSSTPVNPTGPEDPLASYVDVVDANGEPAIVKQGESRGSIEAAALTYWTAPEAMPAELNGMPAVADGGRVERGGAGQRIPGFVGPPFFIGDGNSPLSRQLFIEPEVIENGTANVLLDFDASPQMLARAPYLPAALGVGGADETLALVRWARGQDIDDSDGDGDRSDARPWLMGDVLHSRPLVVNYGAVAGFSATHPLQYVLVGSGAGVLHAFENTDAEGRESGAERWGFLPRSTLGVLLQRRYNDALTSPGPRPRRYGVDGSPVVLTVDHNGDGNIDVGDGDEAWVFFGLRRGGHAYHALDISDPQMPPVLKWKIEQTVGGDFEGLALSFSTPVVGKVRFQDEAVDVLIFAGGYHGGWNHGQGERIGKDAGRSPDPVGNGVYIVNARTGQLLWQASVGTAGASNTRFSHPDMVHSIASTVSVMRNAGGLIHRLYVGDTGGGVWRVDLPPGDEENHRAEHWFVSKLADLAGPTPEGDRRFFHPPDIVQARDVHGSPYDGIVIASGNRAAPGSKTAADALFFIRDYALQSGDSSVRRRANLTLDDLAKRAVCIARPNSLECERAQGAGWYLPFTGAGEKGFSSPLTVEGRIYLSTYIPPGGPEGCDVGTGRGALYVVSLQESGSQEDALQIVDLGEGLPPEPTLVGNSLWLPGTGTELGPEGAEHEAGNPLVPVEGSGLYRLYIRELGLDKL